MFVYRGIADDRSKDGEHAFFAFNNQRLLVAPRKLRLDDTVHMTVDLDEGLLTISVNDGEFAYSFTDPTAKAPKGNYSGYWFGATFG